LGGGIIIRRHQAARRPPLEELYAHAARGTRKTRSRQHGTDDSEVPPSGHLIGCLTILKSLELTAGSQLDKASPQKLQLGLIVLDFDAVRVATVALYVNATRPVVPNHVLGRVDPGTVPKAPLGEAQVSDQTRDATIILLDDVVM
jgi:hypothetical protein